MFTTKYIIYVTCDICFVKLAYSALPQIVLENFQKAIIVYSLYIFFFIFRSIKNVHMGLFRLKYFQINSDQILIFRKFIKDASN